jgi:hypothetical protein
MTGVGGPSRGSARQFLDIALLLKKMVKFKIN